MKEVNDNSPLKTDDKDPRVIADVIRLGRALIVIVPEGRCRLSPEAEQCEGEAHRRTHGVSQSTAGNSSSFSSLSSKQF